MKVALFGSFPPEIGGVSVHLYRLAKLLNDEKLLFCVYSNTNKVDSFNFNVVKIPFSFLKYSFVKSFIWIFVYGFHSGFYIIHFHFNPVWNSFSIWILSKFSNKKIVCSIHDQMIFKEYDKYPSFFKFFFNKIINDQVSWITVSDNISVQLKNINPTLKNIRVIPAYLFDDHVSEELEDEVEVFFSVHKRVVLVYAHSSVLYEGKDLYGVDQSIKAVITLLPDFPDLGCIICIPGEVSDVQKIIYFDIVKRLNKENHFLFFFKAFKNPNFVLKKSFILLRATLTDGDSVMVREALNFGIIVVASNVVNRPEGVITFDPSNFLNLISILKDCLNPSFVNYKIKTLNNGFYSDIKDVYFN